MIHVALQSGPLDLSLALVPLQILPNAVRGAVAALEARFPGFADALGTRFAVAIDGEILQDAWHEPLPAGSELHFLPALSGGR